MSHWNIAAAQYAPLHDCVDDHVEHHLRFITAAAGQQCQLLVFPELSLTGPAASDLGLPSPPGEQALAPIVEAVRTHAITVIAGLSVDVHGQRQKGLALFSPSQPRAIRYPQGRGACLMPGNPQLTIVDGKAELPTLDPLAALFASSQAVGESRWREAINRLQRFAHKHAIAVLMANAHGSSALWDSSGQLIVRADQGELLLTGSWGQQGWQGDIIPLR
jgi:hypothetical protein